MATPGPEYSVMSGDWPHLEYIINDLSHRIIDQEISVGSDPVFGSPTMDSIQFIGSAETFAADITSGAENDVFQLNAAGKWENRSDLKLPDGANIGIASDTDLLTLTSNQLDVAGALDVTGLTTSDGFTSSGGDTSLFNTIISGLDSLLDVSAITVTPALQNIIKFDACTLDVTEFAAFQPLNSGMIKRGDGDPGWLQLCAPNSTASMIRIGVDADPYARLKITADGKMEWGIGVLVDDVIRDTNLYRSAADTLKTDDAFSANNLIIRGFTLIQVSSDPAILTADDIIINAESGILDLKALSEITLKPGEDTANFFKFNSNLTDLTLSTTDGSNLTITPAGGNTIITGRVGIGTITNPNAPLEVKGPKPGSIGGFQSGMLHVTGSGTAQFSNSVITGHNAFNTNTQLWYLGSMSSSNDDIAFINRQNAAMHFSTNNASKMIIDASGNVGIGLTTVDANYKLIVRRAADVNFGIGLQSSELAIAAFNDAISANIPMRFYASEFNFLNGKVGMGVIDPDVKLEIFDTGTQLKLSYDAGNHTTFATGSDGDLTIATVDS
ncbi:hypothetical protein LCGC14_0936600, partial [marine sediment metagenome]